MSRRKRNVLVLPAGTEVGLEINNALKHCKEVALYGAGQGISNHALFAFPEYHVMPSIHQEGWLTSLVDLVQLLKIDYIFPAYDDVIVALSRVADRIPAAILSSPGRTCEITRSKSATYRELAGRVRVPHVYEAPNAAAHFPLLIKPDRGQGSQGVRKVSTEDELRRALCEVNDAIICEYLPGEEFTVDCFSDRERGLLFAAARSRNRIRNGISVNTVTARLAEAKAIAEVIGQCMQLHGAWFFQLKRSATGELTVLEIAPRIAGAMAAHRVTGVNFPLLSIFEHERLDVQLMVNRGEVELDRALSNRYRYEVTFATAYIDLDDTLITDDRVNVQAIKFIYQCVNQGKTIKLITRHQKNLGETLRKHRLLNLFDDVIHLRQGEPKSSLIVERDAIFIDDSFAERQDVANIRGIPTFDGSMLEVLTERAEKLIGEKYVRSP